jgi:hypothetical protein
VTSIMTTQPSDADADANTDTNTDANALDPQTKPTKFFKAAIPHEMIHGFIKKISYRIPNSENHYLIDLNAYKKAMYCSEPHLVSLLDQFCRDLLPFYCKEKQIFLTRKMSYNNMNTILRQVCRHCAIECRSERKYDKSKTQIVYYIILND